MLARVAVAAALAFLVSGRGGFCRREGVRVAKWVVSGVRTGKGARGAEMGEMRGKRGKWWRNGEKRRT